MGLQYVLIYDSLPNRMVKFTETKIIIRMH